MSEVRWRKLSGVKLEDEAEDPASVLEKGLGVAIF